MNVATIARTTLLITALAVAVTACGRRPSSLDTPYDAGVKARQEAERNEQPLPPEPKKPVEDRPFILDRLI